MNVLVTGASGFVGGYLCTTLVNGNVQVSAVVRKANNNLKNVQLIIKELNAQTNWKSSLSGIDVVIHLAGRAHVMKESSVDPYQVYAGINVDATRNLAEQAAESGVKRFIFLSSVKVNGESTVEFAFNESNRPQPEDDYGKSKNEAEKVLNAIGQDTEMEVVIIRPPLVYGKGVKANFKNLIKLSQSGFPLPLGAIHNKRSLIYIENLVDFIILCMRHPRAGNETFMVSDGDDVSITQLISSIQKASKSKSLLLPVPKSWLIFLFHLIGKRSLSNKLFWSLQVNIDKAKTLLEWNPPFGFKAGITKTVQPANDN